MRIRTIKPEFFIHDGLADQPPLARLLFIGLWGLADIAGRLEDKPRRIKAQVLPYDECCASELLEGLEAGGFITRYEVGGRGFIEIPNFRKHQRISGKEAELESELPAPAAPPAEADSGKNREALGKTEEAPAPHNEEAGIKTGDTREVVENQQGSTREKSGSNGEAVGKNRETVGNAGREGKGKEYNTPPKPPPRGEQAQGHSPSASPTTAAASAKPPETPKPPPKPPPKPGPAPKPAVAALAAAIPIPPKIDSPRFRELWSRWLAVRLGGRSPKRPWEQFFAEQLDWLATAPELGTEATAAESLAQSLRNGWAGLFPPKTSTAPSRVRPSTAPSFDTPSAPIFA